MSSPGHRLSSSQPRRVRMPTRSRALVLAGAAGGAILLLALAAYIYDHSRRDVIANGVRIAGIDVGGLHEAAARAKVQHKLSAELRRPITVHSGSRSWRLYAHEAQLKVDVPAMVSEAVSASREGSIVSRTMRGLFGGTVHHDVPLIASYSLPAVRRL